MLLKLETLQPTFSYKIRGAVNAVLRFQESHGRGPLVTASAGNHGRALAYAAAQAGIQLTVYVPAGAPRSKLDAIRALGCEMVPCASYDEAEERARAHAASGRALFISPYSHPDVIAGAGTVGLEIVDERPDVAAIAAAIGGGGLTSGVAIAAAARDVTVIACEAEASQPFTQGRAAGRIVTVPVRETLADGLAGNLDPATITFEIVQRLVPQIVLVSEAEIRAAMRGVVERERLVAEGAAAVAVAAVLSRRLVVARGPIAVILSGANVDRQVLKAVL